MRHIRLASEAEIDAIRSNSDLMPGHTTVLALDADEGTADIAVLRNCWEINPVHWGSNTKDTRRARFMYTLEERLLGANIDRYYFQIDASNRDYIETVRHWGAEEVSPHPEIRMLKVIK